MKLIAYIVVFLFGLFLGGFIEQEISTDSITIERQQDLIERQQERVKWFADELDGFRKFYYMELQKMEIRYIKQGVIK